MSRRKTITPQGLLRQAEVINLADWNKEPSQGDMTVPKGFVKISTPLGADLDRDNFSSVKANSNHPDIGARRGDRFVIYHTDDVREGDYAALTHEEMAYAGIIEFSEVWIYMDGGKFHRAKCEILGRAVEIQRNGERITPKMSLRPIREAATVHQFRRCAR